MQYEEVQRRRRSRRRRRGMGDMFLLPSSVHKRNFEAQKVLLGFKVFRDISRIHPFGGREAVCGPRSSTHCVVSSSLHTDRVSERQTFDKSVKSYNSAASPKPLGVLASLSPYFIKQQQHKSLLLPLHGIA
ncbi:hypothetical protein JOB18_012105 [Solea senegalensis]|uniref:Uncharacterized protein n=1 Tax=Solea senegalensis TaxID=28829 RepID=A0AAV6Q643_SOLSE|nr:hypothetical protein JOB18_012105 [Solea senegalensis]